MNPEENLPGWIVVDCGYTTTTPSYEASRIRRPYISIAGMAGYETFCVHGCPNLQAAPDSAGSYHRR